MTDLEKFIALYKSFGIDCIVEDANEGFSDTGLKKIVLTDVPSEIAGTFSDKFEGYGMYTVITFKDGKFISQGFWE